MKVLSSLTNLQHIYHIYLIFHPIIFTVHVCKLFFDRRSSSAYRCKDLNVHFPNREQVVWENTKPVNQNDIQTAVHVHNVIHYIVGTFLRSYLNNPHKHRGMCHLAIF